MCYFSYETCDVFQDEWIFIDNDQKRCGGAKSNTASQNLRMLDSIRDQCCYNLKDNVINHENIFNFQNIMVDEAEDSMLGGQQSQKKRNMDAAPGSPGPRKRKPGLYKDFVDLSKAYI
jgi:hypothetical protein